MDHNSEIDANISKGGTRITPTIDSGKIPPLLNRVSLQGQTSPMGTTIQTTEDHMISAQISPSIETMEIDVEMNLSTTRMGTSETMEVSPVLHRFQGETSHKKMLPRTKK